MHKFFEKVLLVIGTLISLILLMAFINFNIMPVLIIILLGIISFTIDYLVEREFSSSFNFINMISNRAHSSVKKFWNLAKCIMFILVYEMIDINVISLFFNTEGIEEKILLYNAAIFAGGIAAIATIVSYKIKEIYGDEYKKHKSLVHGFSIEIPNYWEESDQIADTVAIKRFTDELEDKACFIFRENKVNFTEGATIDNFSSVQIESFLHVDEIEVECSNDEKYENKKFVAHNVCIHKKKYMVFQFFAHNKNFFYEVRVVIPNKSIDKKEYLRIIASFKA